MKGRFPCGFAYARQSRTWRPEGEPKGNPRMSLMTFPLNVLRVTYERQDTLPTFLLSRHLDLVLAFLGLAHARPRFLSRPASLGFGVALCRTASAGVLTQCFFSGAVSLEKGRRLGGFALLFTICTSSRASKPK